MCARTPALLQLVADLRSRGTWEMDTIGMASAANQAFAIWVYQALMPTVYDRYTVSDCYPNSIYQCTGPAAGPGVVLRNDLDGFITIGPRYDYWGNVPCKVADSPVCNYTTASSDVMSHVWGQVSDGCTYVPVARGSRGRSPAPRASTRDRASAPTAGASTAIAGTSP